MNLQSLIVVVLRLIALNFLLQNRLSAAETNLQATATNLVPLLLKLPMPSWGNNGPFNPETGPHIEKFSATRRPALMVPPGITNLARNKKVTSSAGTPITGSLSQITDGQKEALDEQTVELRGGEQWVQIDLEQECQIFAIVIWHDFRSHLPIFRSVVVQAANNPAFTNHVATLFNNDYEHRNGTDKQYFESNEGKLIAPNDIKTRYLRFYSNGSSNSPLNGYAEIEIWGFKPSN